MVLSTDDVTNLQAALNGRALQPDLRVVLRLFDGDLARRIETTFGIESSHSVSYLAAPAFAAALRRRRVFATIPIERHALLVTEVIVAAGSPLDGRPIRAADQDNGVRVIAVVKAGERPLWSPPPDTPLGAGDTLMVVARRAGLGWLTKQATVPPGRDGAAPATVTDVRRKRGRAQRTAVRPSVARSAHDRAGRLRPPPSGAARRRREAVGPAAAKTADLRAQARPSGARTS